MKPIRKIRIMEVEGSESIIQKSEFRIIYFQVGQLSVMALIKGHFEQFRKHP